MICCNSVNTGSSLPNISDVMTRKRWNVIEIDMIRNNHIRFWDSVNFQKMHIDHVQTEPRQELATDLFPS